MLRSLGLLLIAGLLFATGCDPAEPPQPQDACGGACGDSQACVSGTCKDKVCEPFAKACRDSILTTCNGNGTKLLEEQCPASQACVADSCVATLCIPGSNFCGSDGERKRCNADGVAFSSDPCGGGTGCSGAGECVNQICTPGAVRCLTAGTRDVERCNAAGVAYASSQCDANAVCYADQCQRIICNPGLPGCVDAQTAGTCDATGTAFASTTPCHAEAGEQCDTATGTCATACDMAATSKSYIGCDYFFAITDNAANQMNDQNDQMTCTKPGNVDFFPSGVVVANTNAVAARITLRDANGAIVTLPGQQRAQELPMPSQYGCRTAHTTPLSTTVDSKILVGTTVATVLNGQRVEALEIPPGATAQLLIVSPYIDGTRKVHEGFNLTSTLPVAAYLYNPICCNFSYSNDASLLIPRTAWRNTYFAVSTPHLGGAEAGIILPADKGRPAGFAVLAAEDNTQIAIQLRSGQAAAQFTTGNGVPAFSGNELRTTLMKGDVLQLETQHTSPRADVTGVLVAGDKPIGVIGFHECTYVPQHQGACDHVEEMLPPIETWGKEYVAVMPKLRNPDLTGATNQERIYYRFVSSADTNRIAISPKPTDFANAHDDVSGLGNGGSTPTCSLATDGSFVLGKGGYCEFGTRDNFRAVGNSPYMVAAIFSGQESTGLIATAAGGVHAGDPSLSLLVAVDQWRRSYTFLTPDTYWADFVTVTYRLGSPIELDGALINPDLLAAYGNNELVVGAQLVTGTDLAYMTLKLARGAHKIRSRNAANADLPGERFAIFNYGYDDYVSYAYPGGMDLVQTSTFPNVPF